MRPPLLFAVVLLVALAWAALGWQVAGQRAQREAARARATEARLAAVLDSLRGARLAAGAGAEQVAPVSLIPEEELESLRQLGLADPAVAIRRDLTRHPELIPFPGTLGGTMGFYDTTGVIPLNDHWVFARFEDGHVGGSGLFEYRVRPGGRITWKTVTAALD